MTNINLVNGDLTIAGLMDGYILCERDKMCWLEKAFLTAASRQTSTAMFQTCTVPNIRHLTILIDISYWHANFGLVVQDHTQRF